MWSGELKVEPKLNTEVTTAFPVGEALKDIGPGVYAMIATPKDALVDNDYDAQATQWFIVSDLGLTAYTAHDGVDVFVHSLASAEPSDKTEVRLIARNNEVLAVAADRPVRPRAFRGRAGARRGRPVARPRWWRARRATTPFSA